MSEAGFFEQRRASPGGFAIVVAMHAAAIGAVVLIKGPQFIREPFGITTTYNVPPEVVPDEVPPPRTETKAATVIETVPPVIRTTEQESATVIDTRPYPLPLPPGNGTGETITPRVDPPPVPDPVRREAQVDQRYVAAFQPPYPTSEQRAEREGSVRIRVTIGADGRVRAVERVSATSDAFWAVAERQALRHWRFRPATLDGRPVESTKVMTLYFRLADV